MADTDTLACALSGYTCLIIQIIQKAADENARRGSGIFFLATNKSIFSKMIAQHQTDAQTFNNITNFTTGSAAKNNPIKVKSCPGEEAVTATFSIWTLLPFLFNFLFSSKCVYVP